MSSRADAAYQGSPGAYSEEAAWALLGRAARLQPCTALVDVFDAVGRGDAIHAVVPVENSLAGTVPRVYELLLERDLIAIGETCVRIEHVLAGHPSAARTRISRVLSHPVALDQCLRFFRGHPELEAVPVFDTSGAVAMAMAHATGDVAAIASRRAAALHGAAILAEGIQDRDENWTRFLLLTGRACAPTIPIGRKAIAAFSLPHQPGTLCRALETIAALGLSLTKIESRPIQDRPFEYAFIAEIASPDGAGRDWSGALDALRSATTDMRCLGAF